MSATLAFVDTETTGLDPSRHAVWEIAVIRRDPDGTETEHLWQIRLHATDIDQASPDALRIGRYHERHVAIPGTYTAVGLRLNGRPGTRWLYDGELEDELNAALLDAVIVGSNPAFDTAFLQGILGRTCWHYRPVDVATLAAGFLHGADCGQQVTVPHSSRALSEAVGTPPPGPDVAHTALGDARWARDLYDAITHPELDEPSIYDVMSADEIHEYDQASEYALDAADEARDAAAQEQQ